MSEPSKVFVAIMDTGEPEPPRKKRKAPWNEHDDIALIANNGGTGCILVSDGAAIEYSQENGCALDDNGLDDAPDGLSIWEGRGHSWETNTDMGHEYDFELRGTFRDLTDREWALLRETGTPWEFEE